MPSKRERGKQRKAVKNLAAGNGNESIAHIVAKVSKGDNYTTINIGSGSPTHSLTESNGISYEQSGILSMVLKFLQRCEDDTFVKVMLDIGGGNLKSPVTWIRVLIKAEIQEDSCRLRIAQSIGPLVRCMCNDATRLFFKSNKDWREGIHAFAALIHNILRKCDEEIIIDTLFQYEGLLTSIVQWGFWDKDYRPDIMKEITTEHCKKIVEFGSTTLNRLIMTADGNTEEGRKTPIVSKKYNAECTISFVVGLIRQVNIDGWITYNFSALRRLINIGCVDKDVITEMISLGFNTSDDKWVAQVASLLWCILLKQNSYTKYCANDTRTAFAIRGGLVELCLHFIERFGVLESFDKEKDDGTSSLFFYIERILTNTYFIQLHKKTAKAIRSKRCSIEQELARLKQNADISSNSCCKELLDIAKGILDLNGSYCCRCNKSLCRTEVKLCNGCGLMPYCSRACQKEDWLNGHISCCKTYTTELAGLYQGRLLPEVVPSDERVAAKLKELEINLSSVQLKLFLDHSESILSQAEALDIPLYDCIVRFDLTKCPLEVTAENNEIYRSLEEKTCFECSRSKKNITCIYTSFFHYGSLVEGQVPRLRMQRLFPHEWLSTRKAHEINKDDYQCVLS